MNNKIDKISEIEKKKELNDEDKRIMEEELRKNKVLFKKMESILKKDQTIKNKIDHEKKTNINKNYQFATNIYKSNITPKNNLKISLPHYNKCTKDKEKKESNVLNQSADIKKELSYFDRKTETGDEPKIVDKEALDKDTIDNQNIINNFLTEDGTSHENFDKLILNDKNEQKNENLKIYTKKNPTSNLTKFVHKKITPIITNPVIVNEMLERMEKYSNEKVMRLEAKKKHFANELLSKIQIPQINERSRKLVNKDFFTRQEDYKTAISKNKKNLFILSEEKIKRELTPDLTRKRTTNDDRLKSREDNINFHFQWNIERNQRIDSNREKETLYLSQECTFTPKICRKSDFISKNINKETVTNRLFNQDISKKRKKYTLDLDI